MARRRLTTLLAATLAAGLVALPASAQSLADITETTDTVTETVEDTVDQTTKALTGDGSDGSGGDDGGDDTTADAGVDAKIEDDGASVTATVGDQEVTVDTDDVTGLLPDEETPVPPPGDDPGGDDPSDDDNNSGPDTRAADEGGVEPADQPADGQTASGGTATAPPAVRVDRGYSPDPSTPLVSDHIFGQSLGQSDEVDEQVLPQVADEAPEDEAVLATQTPTGDDGTDGALMRIVAALMVAATAGLWQRQYRATVS